MSYPPPPHATVAGETAFGRTRILRPVEADPRDEYRSSSLEMWHRMASGWERRRADIDEAMAPVREWLVAELAPRSGETILESLRARGTPDMQRLPWSGSTGT